MFNLCEACGCLIDPNDEHYGVKMSRTFPLIKRCFWSKPKSHNFGKYEIVTPGSISPQKTVPDHIPKPSYYYTGEPSEIIQKPEIKTTDQINKMRKSCKLAANILKYVGDSIKIGQTTDEIDNLVHDLTLTNNAYPSPLNYKRYPKSVCTSVNNVACHGIPDDRPLKDGDIINVDVTVFLDGCHGDCSKTFLVGDVDDDGRKLVTATEMCLAEAIKLCRPQTHFCEIGALIEERALVMGFKVVPCFLGHGIGHYFHGPPDIYHSRNWYAGKMLPGMTFTIEPVLTQGDEEIEILEDNWTAVTVDDARTAQFEHTILITDGEAEILTLPDR